MTSRHTACLVALATTLLAAFAPAAAAQVRTSSPGLAQDDDLDPPRPGDIWTGGGLLFAPRYLENVGDFELGLGPTYLVGSAPGAAASPFAGVAGLQWKVSDAVEVSGLFGPLTLAGIRGPIHEDEFGAYGWALLYRSDLYPVGQNPVATAPNIFGSTTGELAQGLVAAPLLGGLALSQGGELRIDTMQNLGPVKMYFVPSLGVLSDGTRVGLGLAMDVDLDKVVLGGNWSSRLNITPTKEIQNRNTTFENHYSLGGRVILTDAVYVVGNYVYSPADAYGNALANALLGIGYRFSAGPTMKRSK
ncbi:MAG: hypothetical protein FJZ01_21550 [Candidatus Sericytochromatia bacterium]|nr:hypothetical protein [Candidatus Tanganyikabacteria bacterium]